MNNQENNKSFPAGCMIVVLLTAIFMLGIILFGAVMCLNSAYSPESSGTVNLMNRPANNGDIIVAEDADLSNLGVKFTIHPQRDIDNLQVTVSLLDKDKKLLTTKVANLGNVKKGVQVTCSVSFIELDWTVIKNISYESVNVTGGTVSVFA